MLVSVTAVVRPRVLRVDNGLHRLGRGHHDPELIRGRRPSLCAMVHSLVCRVCYLLFRGLITVFGIFTNVFGVLVFVVLVVDDTIVRPTLGQIARRLSLTSALRPDRRRRRRRQHQRSGRKRTVRDVSRHPPFERGSRRQSRLVHPLRGHGFGRFRGRNVRFPRLCKQRRYGSFSELETCVSRKKITAFEIYRRNRQQLTTNDIR